MFEEAPDPVVVVSAAGSIKEANREARVFLNLPSSGPLPKLSRYFPAKTPPLATLAKKLSRRSHHTNHFTVLCDDGVSKHVDLQVRKVGRDRFLVSMREESGREKLVEFVPELHSYSATEGGDQALSLVQHGPYGIAILQDDRFQYVNQTLVRILGYRSRKDLEGKEVLPFIQERSRRSFELLMERRLRGENIPPRFEANVLRSDGSRIDVEFSFELGMYEGRPAINAAVTDISERKALETRLIDSERLFRNVVNSMVDALIITDLQGKVLDVNDEFEHLTGFSRQEVFGTLIPYPWVAEDNLKNYIGWLQVLREKGVLRDFDVTWTRKDGRRIAISLSTTLLRNTAGDPVLMVNIGRDISERQEAQQELAQQFHRLQVLYELSKSLNEAWTLRDVAVQTYQQVKRVIPTDSFFFDLYDDTRKVLHPIFEIDTGLEGRQEHTLWEIPVDNAKACQKVLKDGKPYIELRSESDLSSEYLRFGNKQKSSASMLYVPVFSKDAIKGIISAQTYKHHAYDQDHVTLLESIASVAAIAVEKVILYQDTMAKSQQLEARNKELDEFTYVVSHDLKEPLISVEGYTKILKLEYADRLDDNGRQFIRSILDACLHMKNLIEELLQLSRVGKLAENKQEVDVTKLIRDVIEELRFTIQERKAELRIAKDLPRVVGVEPHLKIVFRNLIANALKFCDKQPPRIEIGMQPRESELVFFVKDNGIGIDPAYHDKVFMIFQRLHQREEYAGTGAGLTIVKKIVEAHGGRIWVESEQRVGSTFFFTLSSM
jgi:PAS domain S-box-containing protein